MKLSNNGGNRVPTDHHSPTNEVSNPAIGLQLVKLLGKEAHKNPQTIRAIAKTINCFVQSDNKADNIADNLNNISLNMKISS